MKKHSKMLMLCLALSLIMAMSLVPTVALAAPVASCPGSCTHEAAIGTTHYDTLTEALTAAVNNDTIKLLKDVTMDKTYFGANENQTLTLDLNGCTLTRTWQDWGAGDDETTKSVIYNQGTLTIMDSSGTNAGKIQGYSDTSGNSGWNQEFKGAAISNASGAVLNLQGGTVTRGDVSSHGYYTVYNKGTFNMSGGMITNGSCTSAMVCNVAGGSKFVMTGGELKQERFQTLKNEPGSTVEISGGTLTSSDRTLQNYGTATISGGTFNGDIQVPESGNLAITNGNINGDLYGREGATGSINISGGTISSSAQILDSDNALVGQYRTLQAAVDAAQNGQTIKLLQNVTIQDDTKRNNEGIITITGNKKITIDGGMNTITVNQANEDSQKASAFNVEGGAKVVFMNLSINGANKAKHGINIYGGEADLNNVNLTNFNGYGMVVQGKATAKLLSANNNRWGGVNVDIGSNNPISSSEFTLESTLEYGEVQSVIVEHTNDDTAKKTKAQIKGGHVGKAAIEANNPENPTLSGASLSISGGTFDNRPNDAYIAEGFKLVQYGQGSFRVVSKTPGGSTHTHSGGNGISVKYNGGNSFSTSKSDVPTGVEIDGVAVPFSGTGSNFTVGCIAPNAKWITVKWNSTSVTTNFTPDALVECSVSIPKTGDMPVWAAVLALFGF